MVFEIIEQEDMFVIKDDGLNIIDITVGFTNNESSCTLRKEEAELLANQICDACAIFYDLYEKHTNERLKCLKALNGDFDGKKNKK